MSKKDKPKISQSDKKDISRRDALRQMGYAAFASSTMFLLLNNPTKAQSTSLPGGGTDPDDGFGDFGGTKSGENNNQPKSNDPWAKDNDPWK